MLPLGLLTAAQGHPMLVELKNGETLNGHLVNCDTWMNLTLKEVVQTSPEGDKFFRLPEVYVRGNNIKYLRVPDEIIDLVKDQQQNQQGSNRGRGGGAHRGEAGRGDRGRGGRGGRAGATTSCPGSPSLHEFDAKASPHIGPNAANYVTTHVCWPQLVQAVLLRRRRMRSTALILEGRWAYVSPQFNPLKVLPHIRLNPVLQHLHHVRALSMTTLKAQAATLQNDSLRARPSESASRPGKHIGERTWQVRNAPSELELGSAADEVEQLECQLREAAQNAQLPAAVLALRVLVDQHKKQPTLMYYKYWIQAACDSLYGSATTLRVIWDEMSAEGILIDSEVFHTFIKALACHPDYLLRISILERMEQRWISLTPEGWNYVVVGLLRENQNAFAAEILQEMRHLGIGILRWVHVALASCFINAAEYVEGYKIMQQISERDDTMVPLNLWHLLLESASRDYDAEIIQKVWTEVVAPGYINVSSGVCQNILIAAVRSGNKELATAVFQKLAARKDIASLDICEPLIELYAASGDIVGLLRTLCSMKENGLDAEEATIRPLITYVDGSSASAEEEPLQILKLMLTEEPEMKSNVPIELLNALMELRLRAEEPHSVKAIYLDRLEYCAAVPNVRTYNLVFLAYQQLRDYDGAMTQYDEWRHTSSLPITDHRIYHTLINLCIDTKHFARATDFIVMAQETGVHLYEKAIKYWLHRVGQQSSRSPDSSFLHAKLVGALEGREIRKEIDALSPSGEDLDPNIRKAADKQVQRIRNAKAGYATRHFYPSSRSLRR